MNHDVPEHELIDDSHDPVARALRDTAPAERRAPSPQLRHRTLDALRVPAPASIRIDTGARRPWMTTLAAAAMIALAVLIYSAVRPGSSTNPQPLDDNPIAVGPGARAQPDRRRPNPDITQPLMTASARLASFTQPLEREAEALRSDLRRVAAGFRNVLPKSESRFNLRPATNPSS